MKIVAKNITKIFDSKVIIDNASFEIEAGEIVGLIGPNGAGKTTVMKMLVGLLKYESGEICYDNKDIYGNFDDYISKVGCSIETPSFYPYMTGKKNLECVTKLYDENEILNEIKDILEIDKYIGKKVSKYSLGMKQRLGVCRAFAGTPKLVILDEPTNGLDVEGIIEFREKIRLIAKKYNISILISSHNIKEIEEICDRVLMINDKKIEEIYTKTILDYVTYRVETQNTDITKKLLNKIGGIRVVSDENGLIINDSNPRGLVLKQLITMGDEVYAWEKQSYDLETQYIEKVKAKKDEKTEKDRDC